MSRLFRDPIRIGLGATYAIVANVRNSRVADWHMQQFAAPAQQSAWQLPLESAMDWLTQMSPRNASVHVTLSVELAPLHLLPWREEITRDDQQTVLARNHFLRVHGDAASNWKVQVCPTAYGAGWLASAVDEVLLQSLTQQVRALNAHVQVVEPLLVSHFNRRQRRLRKADCWMLLAEPEKMVALHLREGRWQLLQTLPSTALRDEPLDEVLLRESRLAGLVDTVSELLLLGATIGQTYAGSDASTLDIGWQTAGSGMEDPHSLHLLGAPG